MREITYSLRETSERLFKDFRKMKKKQSKLFQKLKKTRCKTTAIAVSQQFKYKIEL